MEFSMNVDEKDINLSKLIANEYAENKSKVFLASLGVSAFRNYLADCNIHLSQTASLFRVKKIFELTDIADVNYKSITIDVRTYVSADALYIPKKHFDFNVSDLYYVLSLFDDEKNEVTFKGFINAKNIDKTISNDDFYIVSIDKLSQMEELISEIYSCDEEEELFNDDLSGVFVALLDGELDLQNEIKIISRLYKSQNNRNEFLNYAQFEFIANKFVNFDDLFEQNVDNIQDDVEYNELDFGQENDDSSENDDLQSFNDNETNDDFAEAVVDAVVGAGVDLLENDPELLERGFELISDGAEMISDAIDTFDDLTSDIEESDINLLDNSEDDFENLLSDESEQQEDEITSDDEDLLLEDIENDIEQDFIAETLDSDDIFEEDNVQDEILDIDDLTLPEDDEIRNSDQDLLITETFEELDLIPEQDSDIDENIEELSDVELTENEVLEEELFDVEATDDEFVDFEQENSDEIETADDELLLNIEEDIEFNDVNIENVENVNATDDDLDGDNIIFEEKDGYPVDEESSAEYREFLNDLEQNEEIVQIDNNEDKIVDENIADSLNDFISEISRQAEESITELADDLDDVTLSDSDGQEEIDEYDYSQTNDLLEELNFNEEKDVADTNLSENEVENTLQKDEEEKVIESGKEQNILDIVKENDDIQTLFENSDSNSLDNNELSAEEYVKYVEQPAKSKNKIFIPLLSLVVFSTALGAGVYYKTSHKQVLQDDNISLEQQVKELDEFDDETFLVKDDIQTSEEIVNAGEELVPNPDANLGNDINQSISSIFDETIYPVMISKIAWEIPENYTTSKYFKKYLQVSGVQLQRQLQEDLANVTEISTSGTIKLSFDLYSDNEIKNLKVIESSGSKEIDAISQKTLKETLMYIKVPVIPSSENYVNLTMVINF